MGGLKGYIKIKKSEEKFNSVEEAMAFDKFVKKHQRIVKSKK